MLDAGVLDLPYEYLVLKASYISNSRMFFDAGVLGLPLVKRFIFSRSYPMWGVFLVSMGLTRARRTFGLAVAIRHNLRCTLPVSRLKACMIDYWYLYCRAKNQRRHRVCCMSTGSKERLIDNHMRTQLECRRY